MGTTDFSLLLSTNAPLHFTLFFNFCCGGHNSLDVSPPNSRSSAAAPLPPYPAPLLLFSLQFPFLLETLPSMTPHTPEPPPLLQPPQPPQSPTLPTLGLLSTTWSSPAPPALGPLLALYRSHFNNVHSVFKFPRGQRKCLHGFAYKGGYNLQGGCTTTTTRLAPPVLLNTLSVLLFCTP
jgi:hypothetical protein